MLSVAPYIKIATAADVLKFEHGIPVSSKIAYLAWHRMHLVAVGALAREWRHEQPIAARINHGRWLADCPNCHGGALTHPEWKLACCGECGCVMTAIEFPVALRDIEVTLLKRPVRAVQNWMPGETVADLARENLAHGVI